MNTRTVLAGALGGALLLGALPGIALAQDGDSEITLEGVAWTLTTMAGEAVPEGVTTTLFLSGGQVVGDAGCNSYFGSYELDGDALTFPSTFGATQKLCEDQLMAVEAAYLPLLQETATWAIDEAGALSLAGTEGTVQLVFGEAPVDITASDVDALVATLGDLQSQIDEAVAEVAALEERATSINANELGKRLTATEESVRKLENKTEGLNVEGLKNRIAALEESTEDQGAQITEINKTINKLRDRIRTLEESDQQQAAQIAALEAAVVPSAPAN